MDNEFVRNRTLTKKGNAARRSRTNVQSTPTVGAAPMERTPAIENQIEITKRTFANNKQSKIILDPVVARMKLLVIRTKRTDLHW